MDKLDLILDKLERMESDVKALRADNRAIHKNMEFRDDKECWLSWQLSSKCNYRYILWDEETDEPYSYCDYGNPDLENNDF